MKERLRRHPRLYTLLVRAVFILSPARIFRRILFQTAYAGHRLRSVVLAGPGHSGYPGGIYNPGAVPAGNGGALLLAKAQVCHWWDAKGTHADKYYKGDPVLFELDEEMRVRSSRIIRLAEGFPDATNVGFEDFRMFERRGEIWVNHGMISLVRMHSCASNYVGATPCLSRLDPDGGQLEFLGFPKTDFEVGKIEKNWMFFEQNDDLYLVYSLSPYRLLRLTDREELTFSSVVDRDLGPKLKDIGGYGSMVSLSTNPINYDDEHLLMLVHQIQRRGVDRFYHHWGMLLGKESLMPEKITARPLFSGMGARGRRAGIVYVSSALPKGEDFEFFMGEGDAYVTRRSMTRAAIESQWCELDLHLSPSLKQHQACEGALAE